MPAGVGGMLTSRVIDELAVGSVVGPANNQLAEPAGAAQLASRGILYAPDYLVDAGGVIYLGSKANYEASVRQFKDPPRLSVDRMRMRSEAGR